MTGIATQDQVFVIVLDLTRATNTPVSLPTIRHEASKRGFVGNCSAYRRRINLLITGGLLRRHLGRGPERYTPSVDMTRPWVADVIQKGQHHHAQTTDAAI